MSLKSEIEPKKNEIANADAIKEFLYHSLKEKDLKELDQMFTSLEGQNFTNFDDDCINVYLAKIKLLGLICSKSPTSLRSVRLKNPNISLLVTDH